MYVLPLDEVAATLVEASDLDVEALSCWRCPCCEAVVAIAGWDESINAVWVSFALSSEQAKVVVVRLDEPDEIDTLAYSYADENAQELIEMYLDRGLGAALRGLFRLN